MEGRVEGEERGSACVCGSVHVVARAPDRVGLPWLRPVVGAEARFDQRDYLRLGRSATMELSTSCGCIAVRFGGRWRLVAAGDGRWRALPCPPCSPSPCRPCASWRGLLLPVLLQCQHRPRPPGPSPRPCAHPAQPSSALPPPSSPPCSALARRAQLRHCRSQASYSASRPSARAGRRRQSYQDPLPSRLPRLARLALAFCPSCRVWCLSATR